MQQLKKIISIARKKNIPDQEVQTVLASFFASAIRQASEEHGLDSTLNKSDFEEALNKITGIKNKDELVEFNDEFEKKFMPDGTSFQSTVEHHFTRLVDAFLSKLEKES